MSKGAENVQGEMSKDNVQKLSLEELSLKPFESKRLKDKKKRRIQAIMGMIAKDSHVSLDTMSNQLDVSTKTVWRDITELKEQGVLERIGDDFSGEWKVLKKKK
jgi:predicted HTH transcriptional regulator